MTVGSPSRARRTRSAVFATVDAVLAYGPDQRGAAGDGLQAAVVAAAARAVAAGRDADVADVAGDAAGAAVQTAVADDGRADARTGLDEDVVAEVGATRGRLSHRHEVGVVLDDERCVEPRGEPVAYGEAVPARHPGRADHLAAQPDRTGQADADAEHRASGPQRVEGGGDLLQDRLRPGRDVDREVLDGLRPSGPVQRGDPGVVAAEVGAQDHAVPVADAQQAWPPAAAGPALAGLFQQPGVEEVLHVGGDGRGRPSEQAGEVRPRGGLAGRHESHDLRGRHGLAPSNEVVKLASGTNINAETWLDDSKVGQRASTARVR